MMAKRLRREPRGMGDMLEPTLREILAPVHEDALTHGYTEEELADFFEQERQAAAVERARTPAVPSTR